MSHLPLAKIADVMPSVPARESKANPDLDYVPATYLRLIHSKLESFGELGGLLGYSAQSIIDWVKQGETRKAVELAAQFIYERDYEKSAEKKTRTAVIVAEAHQLKTIKDIINAVGGHFYTIPEKGE